MDALTRLDTMKEPRKLMAVVNRLGSKPFPHETGAEYLVEHGSRAPLFTFDPVKDTANALLTDLYPPGINFALLDPATGDELFVGLIGEAAAGKLSYVPPNNQEGDAYAA
jgi:hypothetical protein